jgi:hypothetical protein
MNAPTAPPITAPSKVAQEALREIDQEMSEHLGIPVRDVTVRRERTQSMFDMLRRIQNGGAILGEGFYIKREATSFAVFRKGIGLQHVAPRVVTVTTMFTPAMFFEGIR